MEKAEFKKGSTEVLICEMKAPSDSVVYWTQKQLHKEECQMPTQNGSAIAAALCNTTSAVVNMSVKEIDNNYSMFHLELQVRHAEHKHMHMYHGAQNLTLHEVFEIICMVDKTLPIKSCQRHLYACVQASMHVLKLVKKSTKT